MKSPIRRLVAMSFAVLSLLAANTAVNTAVAAETSGTTPRLILQITIDGMRGDLLNRYAANFGTGGFRYLLEQGTNFTNAHYRHANTETIVGHTTLATGASPSVHGMVGNAWLDRASGQSIYNIEDADYPLLASRKVAKVGEQVDPAQKLSRSQGRSPRAILASTFSDELSVFHAGKAKIFGISGKDRAAVSMAGHMGKAFWMSTNSGDFVTSTYYYDQYPKWAADWNAKRHADAYARKNWALMLPAERYRLRDQDDRPYEVDLRGYGRVFPHNFGGLDNKLFYTRLIVSPIGDELTANFAETLIAAEQLGQDDVPDYLSVSFSSIDAVNHFFGPSSLETEDNVLRLDRTLAGLLAFVDKSIGLKNTLIVLSADHGMAEMPEYMSELGLPAKRLHPKDLAETVDAFAQQRFGIDKVTKFIFRPYLSLDQAAIKAAGHDGAVVEQAVAAMLTDIEGIALAVGRSTLPTLQNTMLVEAIRHNHHPARSGDIYLVQEPYWFLYEKGPIGVMHGSPWRYDTYVPIIFAGMDIAHRVVHRLVRPMDIAPTLSIILGQKPPSSSEGLPLVEVLQ